MAKSVFGVLTMTNHRPIPDNHPVSPYALPAGANSGFNIAGPMFVQQMLLPGAQAIFRHASASDFSIYNDNMTVTNNKALTWDTFKDDNGDRRKLVIPTNQFKLSINYQLVKFEFTNLNYTYSPGITVHISYQEHFSVTLKDSGNGKKVFGLKSVSRNCQTSVKKSIGVVWGEILGGIVLSAASAVVGGAVASKLAESATVVTESVEEASIELTSLSISDAVGEGEASLFRASSEISSQELSNLTFTGNMSGCLARIGPKMGGAIIFAVSEIAGLAIDLVPEYIIRAAEGKFDQLPTFDDFAEQCIQAHNWPGQTGYQVHSAALRDTLQIGGGRLLGSKNFSVNTQSILL